MTTPTPGQGQPNDPNQWGAPPPGAGWASPDPYGQPQMPPPPGAQPPMQPGMQPPGMQPPVSGMPQPGMSQPVSGMPEPGMQPPGMQPPGMQPPGMQPGGDPGFQPYGPPVVTPPSGNSTGIIIAVVIGLIVLLLGGGGVAVYALSGDEKPVAGPSDSPSPSASPSESPSPSPSPSPSETGPAGDKLSYTEYDKDWKFKLGDVELEAKYVDGRDHDDCDSIEKDDALTDLGCLYGVEVTYKAEKGKLLLTHLILVMSSKEKARDAASEIDDSDFVLDKDAYLPNFSYGKWQRKSTGYYLVITVCTAKKPVSEKKANEYLGYANSDFAAALIWR